MQFWIIEDGEKRGPFEDYELRELIRKKSVHADTSVWYEGAEDWEPAREVSLLASEFEVAKPPPIPEERPPFYPWRRFFARWFDFFLYQLLLALVMKALGMKFVPENLEGYTTFRFLLAFLPLLVIEGAMIHLIQTTPGKFLLRMRVVDVHKKPLSLGLSMVRTLRVWVLGMGMQLHILTLIAHGVGYWFGVKKGAPLWDLVSRHRVESQEISPLRWVGFGLIFFVMTSILGVIIGPEVEEFRKEFLEQMK